MVDQPFSFEEQAIALRKAVKYAYSLKRRNRGKDIPWTGLDGLHWNSAPFPPSEALSLPSLQYHAEQGRAAINVILTVAMQLGIEQGRRIVLNSHDYTFPREVLASFHAQIAHYGFAKDTT